ncbi:putative membrane protein [Streptoalloteichus tenebrarius]|uniref:Membrane protein n=1 Tax=Streptoalloteichus tenebrarius (strain ATCC 17920 / DSM 40477 / JCM 4838 / CBS 697.72 / NBRC 16177 / NCIMB 11028 / NRRL B-12390 / A12253. 1 / ISP 5477) TaxID=1933 RepID=A0ABT1HSB3_STRSD|nr:putative membrane protein [Streptoalloteichus tenebrarius]BFF03564.1 hypothetical protein GCM10020241_52390 [Streptoalloteichus tenebrarius]
MRLLLAALLVPCALASLVGVLLLYPFGQEPTTSDKLGAHQMPVHAEVTAVASSPCTTGNQPPPPPSPHAAGDATECLTVTVRLTDGPAVGLLIQQRVPREPSTPTYTVGDRVVLAYAGADPRDAGSYQLVDFQRGWPLAVLGGVFALAVLVLARWRGLAALGALVISFGVLTWFVLPAILAGRSPVAVAVVASGVIMFVALYLTHGRTARTSTAVLGTLASLVLIGALGWAFAAATRLTGLDEDTANLIGLLGHGIDARGLLLAGVLIGALGVLDDVTVTQASAVWELRRANPALGWRQLYAAGLRIGRDHVGSAVNTLFMAYAGAALPMLLAYSVSGRSFGEVVTAQVVASEVVRTLVGSVGLVAAVPVTTALAAWVAVHEPPPAEPASDSTPASTAIANDPNPDEARQSGPSDVTDDHAPDSGNERRTSDVAHARAPVSGARDDETPRARPKTDKDRPTPRRTPTGPTASPAHRNPEEHSPPPAWPTAAPTRRRAVDMDAPTAPIPVVDARPPTHHPLPHRPARRP